MPATNENADRAFAEAAQRAPRSPRAPDAEAARLTAEEALESAQPPEALAPLVGGAAAGAPFLARLIRREADWVRTIWARPASDVLEEILAGVSEAGREAEGPPALSAALRRARRRAALLTALADLGGVWELEQTTAALTRFAQTALGAAADRLLRDEAARGRVEGLDPDRSGYVALGMGKLGAGELNYSSDIDLIILFDQDRLPPGALGDAKERFARLTRDLVKLMAEVTAEGYVARMDLRLRPDPASTPICLSMAAAESYYEAYGRTWERAAHIKARPVAGDLDAGQAYLSRLAPFIWRRHLDFAAIDDAVDMLARIRSHEGGAEIAVAGQDVKLGAGGIREIEFLAQTRQLILGGRNPALRAPGTLNALRALVAAGELSEEARAALEAAYRHLRAVEHRLQMVEDQQTHRLPEKDAALDRIAGLAGYPDRESFERETRAHMEAVRAIASQTLDGKTAPARTAETAAADMPEPERSCEIVRRWFSGQVRAVRNPRARAALGRLAPVILDRMAAAPDPMRALVRFDRFLSGLPAGVQLFALCESNPALLDLLTEIAALAPRLSDYLARRPEVLDAVLDRDFFEPPAPMKTRYEQLTALLAAEDDYERVLDAARRWAAERRFQIGVGLLRGVISPQEAAHAFTDLAEACLRALWPHVLADQAVRHGAPPGRGAAVLAMGKLGSREMTSSSDLDMIMIYDAEPSDMSDGERPLAATQYYARLTQRLTAALTAPTAEGALYEVDMRLRPSGRSGPLATSLAAFERYQAESAWLWEHMALTRGRVVAGEIDLARDVAAAVAHALAKLRDPAQVRQAAAEMRVKLDDAHPKALRRLWSLKLGRGGLVDLEFIAQTGLLIGGLAGAGGVATDDALRRLEEAGALERAEAATLLAAYDLQNQLQQLERVALDEAFDPETVGEGLRALFARAVDAPDFVTLEARLREAREEVRAIFDRRIGAPKE